MRRRVSWKTAKTALRKPCIPSRGLNTRFPVSSLLVFSPPPYLYCPYPLSGFKKGLGKPETLITVSPNCEVRWCYVPPPGTPSKPRAGICINPRLGGVTQDLRQQRTLGSRLGRERNATRRGRRRESRRVLDFLRRHSHGWGQAGGVRTGSGENPQTWGDPIND